MNGDELLVGAVLRARLARHLAAFACARLPEAPGRKAAVAVVIAPDDAGRACFVITRRAARMREHAGQWALPGGRIEPGEDAATTALRELAEEVGLVLPVGAVLGELDDYGTRSGYSITPVVLLAAEPALLRPNPSEVAAAFLVPLHALGRPGVPRLGRIPESDRPIIQLPIEELDTSIHAPTAAILFQLWEVAVHGRSTRVSHFEQPVFAWK